MVACVLFIQSTTSGVVQFLLKFTLLTYQQLAHFGRQAKLLLVFWRWGSFPITVLLCPMRPPGRREGGHPKRQPACPLRPLSGQLSSELTPVLDPVALDVFLFLAGTHYRGCCDGKDGRIAMWRLNDARAGHRRAKGRRPAHTDEQGPRSSHPSSPFGSRE